MLFVDAGTVQRSLRLFERHAALGAFDALLAAAALEADAEGLVSADSAFGLVPGLGWIEPGRGSNRLL